MKFISGPAFLVMCAVTSMSSGAQAVKNLELSGPRALRVRFEQGEVGALAGSSEFVFARVRVTTPHTVPSLLQLDSYYADGSDAKERSVPTHDRQGSAQAQLWSKNGRYLVLQLVLKLKDRTFDFRNSLLTVFDTRTGNPVTFRGPTKVLGQDTFLYWSTKDDGVAIVRGANGPEEAHADAPARQ